MFHHMLSIRKWLYAILLTILFTAIALAADAQTRQWRKDLFPLLGVNGPILATAVFDDGTGPALYVAGRFDIAGSKRVSNIAKWDGLTWSDVGGGTNGEVRALAAFTDGTGPGLYAAGKFTAAGGVVVDKIARWNGGKWSAPEGAGFPALNALAVCNAGKGRLLYAVGEGCGVFTWIEGHLDAHCLIPDNATALCGWDDGTGEKLYIAPERTWSFYALSGDNRTEIFAGWFGLVHKMISYDDGSGPALYLGGSISDKGLRGIVKYDGTAWTSPGGGIEGQVLDLAVFDDGTGPALYAAGEFSKAGGNAIYGIAKWNGTSWSAVGGGIKGAVTSITAFNRGYPCLYAAGTFNKAGGVETGNVACWDGTSWSALGTGVPGPVYSAAGSAGVAYAGGVGGVYEIHSNGAWSKIATVGLEKGLPFVAAVAYAPDNLYVAGRFSSIDGVPAKNVAMWNGTSWSALGDGTDDDVYALYLSGSTLYAGGGFLQAGGQPANHIAKWSDAAWSALGDGVNGDVYMLSRYGSGVMAGGAFTASGTTAVHHVGLVSGSGVSPIGTGVPAEVRSAALHTASNTYYIGGMSRTLTGEPASPLNKLQSPTWVAVASPDTPCRIDALDGNETKSSILTAGGWFFNTAGEQTRCIARMNSAGWVGVDGGMEDCTGVNTLSWTLNSTTLLAGGDFALAGGDVSMGLAICDVGHADAATDLAIPAAKTGCQFSLVKLSNAVCTGVFGDSFYIEQPNRSSGIRVVLPNHGVSKDQLVTVIGRVRVSADGEAYIYGWSAIPSGSGSVDPVSINNATAGGGRFGLQAATSGPGTTQMSGLNNVGLLVRVFGKVVDIGERTFTVDDGSGCLVRCIMPVGMIGPDPGTYATVTGVCSCIRTNASLRPLIRLRYSGDLDTM